MFDIIVSHPGYSVAVVAQDAAHYTCFVVVVYMPPNNRTWHRRRTAFTSVPLESKQFVSLCQSKTIYFFQSVFHRGFFRDCSPPFGFPIGVVPLIYLFFVG